MRYENKEVDVSPGPAGGHAWQAMSYNPSTGLVYIPALDSSFRYISTKEFKPELGVYNWGIVFRPAPPPAPGAAGPAAPLNHGFLTAWDPITEKEVWRADET